MHDLTHEILHVDGKIGRTFKALLFQPGLLTQEYWSGRVTSWIRPIRVFLVAAALHLVFASGTGPLNLQFDAFRRVDTGRPSLAIYWAESGRSSARDATRTPLEADDRDRLFQRFERAYLAVRYASPLIFAFFSWLMFRRREPHVIRHLIGGLHFYALWYLLAIVVGALGQWHGALNGLGLLSSVYLFFTVRRLYGLGWVSTLTRTAALFAALMGIEATLAIVAVSFAISGQR